jgi:hypothetical protein
MSGAQHTPGPWRLDETTGEITVLRGNRLIPMLVIAPECDGGVMPFDEALANASLAAGAPELLDALQETIDAAQRQLAFMGKGREPSPRLQAAIDKARAAISKATGEA